MPMEEAKKQHAVVCIPPSPLTSPMRCHTPEMIFREFAARRVGLIRALTKDEEAFFDKCDPGLRSMCLYGKIDANWEVRQPEPKELLGINLVRNNMKRIKWLQYIAMRSDAWLIKVSFSLGQNLTAKQRERLFLMMNSLPTVHETFLASDTYQRLRRLEEKVSKPAVEQKQQITEGEDGASRDQIICPRCDVHYRANAFWICCDVCNEWYHGKCVKISAKQADQIKKYECPECVNDKCGHS